MTLCILGSINQDLIALVDRLPRPGETVSARETLALQGGKGANQAIAAARMGAATRMIGCVGQDPSGGEMVAAHRAAGVDTRHVAALAGAATGRAYIASDVGGENQIIVDPGANARVDPAMLTGAALAGATVLLAQLETPLPAVSAFFDRPGVFRILNTAPAVAEAAALFPLVDLLILNQTELARYLDLPREPEGPDEALAARRLFTREGQAAVVTLGAAGAVLIERDTHSFTAALKVDAVDTTGAGDCFCGALAALIASGAALAEALPVANAAAALCVQRRGAGPAMPTRAEVEALLATAPR